MNPNREEQLFQLALTKPADERAEFLDHGCRADGLRPPGSAGLSAVR